MNERHLSEESVRDALRLLAEQDRHEQAPPEVEASVMRQFEVHQRAQTSFVQGWKIAAAVLMMAAISTLLWLWEPDTKPAIRETAASLSTATPTQTEAAAPVVSEPVPQIVRRITRRKPAPIETNHPEMESVTDFIPLANAALPFEQGQLLRVSMPASAMEAVGFPVHEDFRERAVEADILVGEEGLPRAIRFVRTHTSSVLR